MKSTTNEVIEILKSEAQSKNFTVFDAVFGNIFLGSKLPIHQSSGAVYGILVESNVPPICNISPIEGYPKLYPVYWGKDIAPVSRLKAHVQNHQSTGSANLRGIKAIKGKKLLFGAIFVEEYLKFEKHLHDRYRPIKGTNRTGRTSKIIKVIN